jgi:topoisomerase IA-like protein
MAETRKKFNQSRADELRGGTYYDNKPKAEAAKSEAPKFNEGQTATNPQTGEKIIFKNGAWGPA